MKFHTIRVSGPRAQQRMLQDIPEAIVPFFVRVLNAVPEYLAIDMCIQRSSLF